MAGGQTCKVRRIMFLHTRGKKKKKKKKQKKKQKKKKKKKKKKKSSIQTGKLIYFTSCFVILQELVFFSLFSSVCHMYINILFFFKGYTQLLTNKYHIYLFYYFILSIYLHIYYYCCIFIYLLSFSLSQLIYGTKMTVTWVSLPSVEVDTLYTDRQTDR